MAVIAPPEIGDLPRPVQRPRRQPGPHRRNPNIAVNRHLRRHYCPLLVPLPGRARSHQRAQAELQPGHVARVPAAPDLRRRPLRRLPPLLRRVIAVILLVAAAVRNSRRRHPPIAAAKPRRSPAAVDGGPIRLVLLLAARGGEQVGNPRRPVRRRRRRRRRLARSESEQPVQQTGIPTPPLRARVPFLGEFYGGADLRSGIEELIGQSVVVVVVPVRVRVIIRAGVIGFPVRDVRGDGAREGESGRCGGV